MREMLTKMSYHYLAIAKTSFFYFTSRGKIGLKIAKIVKDFTKTCFLQDGYGLRNTSIIFILSYGIYNSKRQLLLKSFGEHPQELGGYNCQKW